VTILHPERFVAGGEALARHPDGRAVFVGGALPGESVQVEVTTDKRDWARARTIEVLEPSADRVEPACQFRRRGCGGCDWMHLAVGAQLAAKASIVEEAMRRTGRIETTVRLGGSVPPTAYRTTVRVVAAADGHLGFRREASHEVLATPGCLVAHPALVGVLASARADPGVEVTLRVSEATGEITARWNPRAGDVHGLPPATLLGGRATLHEQVHGTMLRVSSGSFFQSGPAAAELVVDTVRAMVPELASAHDVVDAYAGVGVLAACVTPTTSRVLAIESSRQAAADARHNLADREATVLAVDVADARVNDIPDVVLADPTRAGLGKAGVAALSRMAAPVLGLVSCDPVALARDAGLLVAAGYRLEQVTVIDLFPQTHHVEAVSRFVRGDGHNDGRAGTRSLA
jgi:23S rRNA (uracil1939-C5)-methyltransferase